MNRYARLGLRATTALACTISASGFAQSSRAVLPIPPAPFQGVINENVANSSTTPLERVKAPANAPNIFLMLTDDTGFAMASTFGGPVPTPNLDRLARTGVRYNRFHTTGICSPTRAALLTGRNHHNVATGILTDMPSNYPGYNGRIPASTATIAQTLRLNGYSTAMFGKHHNVPQGEQTAAGPFDYWPTGLGFEYFFGFIGGDTDQWRTNAYRGTDLLPNADGKPVLLDTRLADDAIRWVHNQKAAAPDKPFFVYYAPGSLHAPHQAPPEWIARFKGQFDQGWDKVREETHARQLALGIIPPGTKLTPRPDGIPAWSSLSAEQKAFAARSMEVAAAMLAYQDRETGRVLDELDRMGVLDTTLVAIIQGDNGASGEGGPEGTINEIGSLANGIVEDPAWLAANTGKLGGEQTYQNYPVGWAWAMNTPLRWTKQFASMLGGIRNGMVISWKGHVAQPDSICGTFSHVIDLAPTLLEVAAIPAPESVYGVRQKPFDGASLVPSLARCDADKPRTQYFEMMGKIGLYHDGWFASNDDGRKSWDRLPPSGSATPPDNWTLYDLRSDFSQSDDVSAANPAKLKELVSVWRKEAERNTVFPLDHRFGAARSGLAISPRTTFDYWGSDVSVPAFSGPLFIGRSFTLDADVDLAKAAASGAIFAIGSHFGGFSLYLEDGRPVFTYARSTKPDDIARIASKTRLGSGQQTLRLTYRAEGFGKGATAELSAGGKTIASGRIEHTFFVPAGLGEMLDIGRDTGVPVTTYKTPQGRLDGDVRHVAINFIKP
jgi:arylsulfatase A-like enzyme